MINIGILAHVDAGKTTLTEQILYNCGIIDYVGRVDNAETTTDNLEVEKQRGITVKTSTVSLSWKGCTLNLLDTPGHVDFISEVERSLSVLDAAVLVLSAREGVQSQSRVLFQTLKRLNIPTVLYINKIDREGVNLEKLYDDIVQYCTAKTLFMERLVMNGQKLPSRLAYYEDETAKKNCMETLALLSESFMEIYERAKGLEIHDSQVQSHLGVLFQQCRLYPVFHGSALHGDGITPILDFFSKYALSISTDELCAKVYKVDRDEASKRRCFIRLFGGKLRVRESYPVFQSDKEFKLKQLYGLSGAKLLPAKEVSAGGIAVVYTKDLFLEDVIGNRPAPRSRCTIAEPTMKLSVEPKVHSDRRRLLEALVELRDEDPFLEFTVNQYTEDIEIRLFGVVQKEIILAQLKERYELEAETGLPATLYKEQPLQKSSFCMCMYKDTFLPATIGLEIEPLPERSGFVYENKISYGDLQRSYQNAVFEGVKKGLEQGLQGWPVTDVKVTFAYSAYDSVNGTPSAYRDLAPQVLSQALRRSGTELLEPFLSYELQLPASVVGRAVSDVLKMRGTVGIPKFDGDNAIFTGVVPVEASMHYAQTLAHYTEGRGVFLTSFYGYRRVKT